MAIDNENLEMVELLIHYNVDTKDALLHAISEEFVEAVEMLLDHEDGNRNKEGHHVSFLRFELRCFSQFRICGFKNDNRFAKLRIRITSAQFWFRPIVMQIVFSIRYSLRLLRWNDIV